MFCLESLNESINQYNSELYASILPPNQAFFNQQQWVFKFDSTNNSQYIEGISCISEIDKTKDRIVHYARISMIS